MTNLEHSTQHPKQTTFGLSPRDMETLRKILGSYTDIENVVIFGSRAKGTYQHGSDIDLAIMNTGLGTATIRKASSDCEESSLPYRVDLIDYHAITHQELKDHIDRVGVQFYHRQTNQPS